jgi:hypothetical protein
MATSASNSATATLKVNNIELNYRYQNDISLVQPTFNAATSLKNTIEAHQTIQNQVEKVRNLDLDVDLHILANSDTLLNKLLIDSPPISPVSQASGKQDRKSTESRHSLMLNIPKPPAL